MIMKDFVMSDVYLRKGISMENEKFSQFSETLKKFIAFMSGRILEKVRNGGYDEESVRDMNGFLFISVIKMLVEEDKNDVPWTTPEETVTELIQTGISKDQIVATHKHLTVKLPNADYRMYRGVAGYPCGTIRITHNESTVLLRAGYLAKDLAQFILLLDAQLPELDKAATDLYRQVQEILRKKQAEAKALEIAKIAIASQLNATLPGLNIACTFTVSDGKVRLNLTRTLQANLTLPLEELSDFLSNPERIESTLVPKPAPEIREIDMTKPWERRSFPASRIGII